MVQTKSTQQTQPKENQKKPQKRMGTKCHDQEKAMP